MRFVGRCVQMCASRPSPEEGGCVLPGQAGGNYDAICVSTATLELSAADVTPVVITLTEEHNLPEALPVCGVGGLLMGMEPGVDIWF